MNQQQRIYLVKKVEETFNRQVDLLKESLPEAPLLNNYLIGAFLDNTAIILDAKKIKANLKKFIQGLGSDPFVENGGYSWNRRRNNFDSDGEEKEVIKIPPALIIDLPKSFMVDFKAWEEKKNEINKKIKELENQKEVLILKINLGSDSILDKLVGQVDSLGELDLFSNKLTLIAQEIKEKSKQITDGKSK